MNHYVYQITNNINGKIYIGKRSCKCSIEDDKYFGSGIHLLRAIKKYGKHNFVKTIIDICESAEQAYELEELIVNESFVINNTTYNISTGGKGAGSGSSNCMFGTNGSKHPWFGKTHTNESKMKMSIALKGRVLTDDHKQKISKNNARFFLGKTRPIETCKKISIANSKKTVGELNQFFGKTHSEETKIKMSISATGRKHSLETKQKISMNNANKGKPRSDETKQKISESNKGRVAVNKGKPRSPEAIAKYKATRLFNKLNKQNLT